MSAVKTFKIGSKIRSDIFHCNFKDLELLCYIHLSLSIFFVVFIQKYLSSINLTLNLLDDQTIWLEYGQVFSFYILHGYILKLRDQPWICTYVSVELSLAGGNSLWNTVTSDDDNDKFFFPEWLTKEERH